MGKILEQKRPVGTVAELFAGVGGFRLGLERAGWETIFSNQWEPSTKTQHASDVYVARFGNEGHSAEDIATVERLPCDSFEDKRKIHHKQSFWRMLTVFSSRLRVNVDATSPSCSELWATKATQLNGVW